MGLLLLRLAHPRGNFLGKVTLHKDHPDRKETREIFVPLKGNGINNPDIKVAPPSPGVLVFRFEESYLYPNCSLIVTTLVDQVRASMRRGKDMSNISAGDRPWNDPGVRGASNQRDEQLENESRPVLHAIVLDFSQVWVSILLLN